MSCKFSELRQKEVVNICDGRRLGCVCDIVLDGCGCAEAIIVPGQPGMLAFFKNSKELFIPWKRIVRFGDDVILVDADNAVKKN